MGLDRISTSVQRELGAEALLGYLNYMSLCEAQVLMKQKQLYIVGVNSVPVHRKCENMMHA